MPTLQQLSKAQSRKKKVRRCLVPWLIGGPQRYVIASKFVIRSPRKPNSAKRRIVKVRMKFKDEYVYCRCPGIGKDINEGAILLMRGGGSKDVSGVNYTVVRGALSFTKIEQFGRQNRRSKFGTKKPRDKYIPIGSFEEIYKEIVEEVEMLKYVYYRIHVWNNVIDYDYFY